MIDAVDGLKERNSFASELTNKTLNHPQAKNSPKLALREALIAKSEEAAHAGQLYEAVRLATFAIDLAPGKADAYLTRASARGALGFFQEAIDDCSKAIALNIHNPQACMLRSDLTHRQDVHKASNENLEEESFTKIVDLITANQPPEKKTVLPSLKGYDFSSDIRAAAFQRYANANQRFRENNWSADFGTVVPTVKNGQTIHPGIGHDRILQIKESTGAVVSEFRFESI